MKKTILKEVDFCDECGTETWYVNTCLRCSKDYCYDCGKERVLTYHPSALHGGSGDGHYCRPCDIALCESKDDPLHQAYLAVRALKDEQQRRYAEWDKRRKAAELRVEMLLAKKRPSS